MVHWYLKYYKHLLLIALLSAMLSGTVWLASRTNILREVENKTVDFRFRLSPHPEKADSSIILVVIDQGSLDYAADSLGQGWPWPRQFYGVVSEYLSSCGAASIAFDIHVEKPDFERGDMDSGVSDAAFAASLQASQRDILGMAFSRDPSFVNMPETATELALTARQRRFAPDWTGAQTPLAMFSEHAALGGITLFNDRDSVIRRAPLYYRHKGKYYPSLGLAAFLQGKGDAASLPQRVPVDRDGCLPLNWYGEGGPKGVYPHLAYTTILACALASRQGLQPPIPDRFFTGRHILVGGTAPGLMDLKTSPYTFAVPGVEIWATQLSNLLTGKYLLYPPAWLELLLIFAISFIVMVLVTRLPGSLTLPGALILLVLISFACWLAFDGWRYAFNYTAGITSLFASLLIMLTISYVAEGRHKRELRNIFTRYLHPDLVKSIADDPTRVKMGGVIQEATVMFTDIKDFTTFCEGKKAEEVVGFLNEYFGRLANIVLDGHGLLDKYAGDGLMAVFGVPLSSEEHALQACLVALQHRALAEALHAENAAGVADIFHVNTRIGINSGLILAGNVGCERRMEYTSIGDPVNLASRLEGVNKLFGTHIIISDSTFASVEDRLLCRRLGKVRVKGKSEITTIYELIGDKSLLDMADYQWLEDFERGLRLYEKGDFAAAKTALEPFSQSPRKDPPSTCIIARCEMYIQTPPATWEGVYELTGK